MAHAQMSFKTYDILSSLIPGALILLTVFNPVGAKYDRNLILAYTAISFLLGYIINAIASWLEGIYVLTWGGKPSDKLLSGQNIWKARFYWAEEVKTLLKRETTNPNPSNDELFSIAMRTVAGIKDSRIEDFNAMYAFSRSLLTTAVLGSAILLFHNYSNWKYYAVLVPLVFITWLRCKQRAYYYAREVLNEYLKKERSTRQRS
jgi:hypothetical protein